MQTKTTADIYKEEFMPLCKCGSGAKAVKICTIPDCPGKAQLLYCVICDDENSLHKHQEFRIAKKVELLQADWSNMVFEKAQNCYDDFNK